MEKKVVSTATIPVCWNKEICAEAATPVCWNKIFTNVSLPNGEIKESTFDPSVASDIIARDSTAIEDLEITPNELSFIEETIERSKGWLEGLKFAISFSRFSFSFEKTPQKETKTIKEIKYKR